MCGTSDGSVGKVVVVEGEGEAVMSGREPG